ncbi:ABC-F family ATP-binding cassette domain-containing protein [Aurantibacillus circumpalustris]|uniref:ABC-F family ATP-binding cassette domain-containing protein n=1 Tax=Aurantibacillus circumpalustris TaxID=3036359 RepID=UPI00295BBCE8|nr:ABC-F family ATP-binding cassette domain-containing protein [Aurantibacillus circumpalustris]
MNLLSINNISKAYGAKVLFNKISFGINYGEKVALVAKNGSGKTTLFKILKGIEIADEGEVVFRKDITVGFLEQNFAFDETLTIQQLIDTADNQFVRCIRNYDAIIKLSETDSSDQVADKMEIALNEMNLIDAWDYEKNILEILSRLEIRDTSRIISTLSGGQKKRVALALTLINKPNLIIMDEPTNHLDIEMIEWLENYLQDASISILLVTHDRYFLDEVCDKIIEIDNHMLYEYKGNFDYYLEKKAEREQITDAEIDKARNLYRKEVVWVRKMPKARGTKSKSRVDAFYETEKKAKQKRVEKKIELTVKMERMGSKIVELHNITKNYPNKVILSEAFTYTFIPGEKIGVVGKNGTGKTTLLNIIQGKESVDTGKVSLGDTIVFGYYSQSGMVINNDKRIIEIIQDIAEHIPLANGTSLSASQLLTRFNFPPNVQYSYAHTLSGGEKRRLFLLTVLMKNPNFLILDEPTNDLDIVTLQTLEDFLEEFKGCVLIVSHDRYFIDRLVDHTFVLEGNGAIKDYPGNYTEYRNWISEQKEEEKETIKNAAKVIETAKVEVKQEPKNAPAKKLSFKVQHELDELEIEIPILEEKKLRINEELAGGVTDYNEIQKLTEDLKKLTEELDQKSIRWLEIQEELS